MDRRSLGLSENEEMILAFAIFNKYPQLQQISARKGYIFAGPNPKVVTKLDRFALLELGWFFAQGRFSILSRLRGNIDGCCTRNALQSARHFDMG